MLPNCKSLKSYLRIKSTAKILQKKNGRHFFFSVFAFDVQQVPFYPFYRGFYTLCSGAAAIFLVMCGVNERNFTLLFKV